jgi:hypothetical protein
MRIADHHEKHGQAADHRTTAEVVGGPGAWTADQESDEERHRQHQHDQRLHHDYRAGRQGADLEQEAEEVAGDREQPARIEQQLHQAAGVLLVPGAGTVRDVVLHDDRRAVDDRRGHTQRDGDGKRHEPRLAARP